jgi:hypothetical protein
LGPLEKDWCIEEEFENGKDIGLDHYEGRSFVGWFRHMTLVLLVLALLRVVCAREHLACAANASNQLALFPIALTVPEVRRLLGRLLFPLSRRATFVLGCLVVAQVSAGQGQGLSCQTSPQLQLTSGLACLLFESVRGCEVRVVVAHGAACSALGSGIPRVCTLLRCVPGVPTISLHVSL